MIRLFIFDLDGVLYQDEKAWRLERFAERCGRRAAEVRRLWEESGWEDEAERGRFATGADYLCGFNDLLGTDFTVDEWVDIRRQALTLNEDVLNIGAKAKANATVAVVTNNAPLLREQIAHICPHLPPVFGDHIHVSADFGARKPERKLFEAVMARYGTLPETTAFTDDSQSNVSAARALGITAHHFVSAQGLSDFISGLWPNIDN